MDRVKTALKTQVIVPADLKPEDVEAWRALQRTDPVFANPLFSPEFALAVGQLREDVRIAIIRRGGEAAAFFPFHQRPGGIARPIGAPFSDYQAVVSKRDVGSSGPEILRLAGARALRASGLVDPYGLFPPSRDGTECFAVDLDVPPDEYLERVRAASPKRFKNYRRLEHRLEREIGPLRLVGDETSPAVFRQIMTWKSEQFRRTGLQDVLRPTWTTRLMQNLFETRTGEMRGLMMALYAGDVLLGAHFGIRSATTFHPWVASTNPHLAAYSPGQAFLGQAIRAMPELGLNVYDLGPGHDHYKRHYANVRRTVGAGLVTAAGPAGALAGAGEAAWAFSGLGRVPALDKIRRRLDHINTIDPSLAGLARGLAEAAAGAGKRSLGNQALSEAVA